MALYCSVLLSHAHSHTCTHTHSFPHILTHAHTLAHSHYLSSSPTALPLLPSPKHTHTHTPHTHAHTHTLILSLHSSLQLIQNNTVMGALTRVLQEEFKKSTELTFNILRYVRLYVQLSRRTSTSSFYCYSMIDMIVGCCTEC
jgi:Kinesin-associated protein (KAP)